MNKQRRKQLGDAIDALTAIEGEVESLRVKFEALQAQISAVRDEEQDAYDNLPDALKEAERGVVIEEGLTQIDEALGAVESVVEALQEFSVGETSRTLDEARGGE